MGSEAPDRIWLQWHGDADPAEYDTPVESHEVSWCDLSVFDGDVEYARADLLSAAERELADTEGGSDEH